ncbi:MAG: (deoxy)nucleoside triphosphate pyrophosphohydrolase [Deltaproteobacteria bacterium]|nr:(deoxy)nucleoside triphosphate pyrophosphohydrolase [Deltaproteobacteria bacterium]
MLHREKPHYNVTAVIIWREGRVLVTRRPQGTHLEGLWEFPGGKQEEGETLSACLEREIREELGIRIEAANNLFSISHDYDSKSITLHVFECKRFTGEPRPLEGQEIRWTHPGKELSSLGFPPPDKAIIDYLIQSFT